MHFGHIPNSYLARAIAACREHLSGDCTVVIRAIDSIRSTRDLACQLSGEIPFRIEHQNVCCDLDDVSEDWLELLDGFEEMWIFDGAGPDRSLAELPALTSDHREMATGHGRAIAVEVLDTGCRIALGDGCGLNYVARDEVLAECVRRAT